MVVVEYSYAAATTIDLGVVVLMSYYSLALLYCSLFSIYIIYMCTCCVFHRMRSMVDAECREREVGTFSIFFDWRGSSCRDSYSYQTFVTSSFSKVQALPRVPIAFADWYCRTPESLAQSKDIGFRRRTSTTHYDAASNGIAQLPNHIYIHTVTRYIYHLHTLYTTQSQILLRRCVCVCVSICKNVIVGIRNES